MKKTSTFGMTTCFIGNTCITADKCVDNLVVVEKRGEPIFLHLANEKVQDKVLNFLETDPDEFNIVLIELMPHVELIENRFNRYFA